MLLGMAALWCAASFAQDAREIILRSAALDQRDLDLRRNYTYLAKIEQRRLDSQGRLRSSESQQWEILVLYGSPYRRLIAKNGRPLSADEQRKEQAKLEKEMNRRKKTAEKDPGKLSREESRELEEQKALLKEIADAFAFQIEDEDQVDGFPCWRIRAEPVPGYRPKSRRAKMLPSFHGVLWITKEEYRWARVEAEAIRTVSFGWILARLQPGSRLWLEQQRVQDEIWLPSVARLRLFARLGLVRKLNAEVEVTFSNYRKFQAESRVIETQELP
ncbi:MAG: hypothetical protein ACUVXB_05225 [Bryobacteraceae bacterium]